MNSDQLTPDTLSSADVAATTEETTKPATRRARGRRATTPASPAPSAAPGPEVTTDVTSDTGVPATAPAPSRRRRRATTTQESAPARDGTPLEDATLAPGTVTSDEVSAPALIQPLNAQDALVSEGGTGAATAADAPLSRNRRRRGRGGRAVEPAALVDVDLPLEADAPPLSLNPIEPELLLDGQTLDDTDVDLPFDGADAGATAGETPTEGGPGSGRRRRRRGRGGRGAVPDVADADADALLIDNAEDVAASDISDLTPVAALARDGDVGLQVGGPTPSTAASPTVRRRFDHTNWRERLGVGAALTTPAAPVDAVATTRLTPASTPTVPGSATPSAVPGSPAPPAFDRGGRGRRFSERPSYARPVDSFGTLSRRSAPSPRPLTSYPRRRPAARS